MKGIHHRMFKNTACHRSILGLVSYLIHLIFLSILIIGCKSYDRLINTPETASLELGMVGLSENTLTSNKFKIIAQPELSNNIRLIPVFERFNKADFSAYQRFKDQRNTDFNVDYVDSLPNKPEYVRFEIIDKTGMLEILENKINAGLKQSIQKQPEMQMITSIDVVLSTSHIALLKKAEMIYLDRDRLGMPAIKVLQKNMEHYIHFSDGIVLSYTVSRFCWGLDNRNEPEIMALTDKNESCPNSLKRKGSKLKKEENYNRY